MTPTDPPTTSKKMLWSGRIISAIPALMLLFSGVLKLIKPAPVTKEFIRLGYADRHALGIGVLEIACTILYLIPRTAVLGAILLAAYLGGATATHVRVGDPFYGPVIVGVLVWLGLYLRDARVRALVPLKK